jgi:hypothetical protein
VLLNTLIRSGAQPEIPNPLTVARLNSTGTAGSTGSASYNFNSFTFGDGQVLTGDIFVFALLTRNASTGDPLSSFTMSINGDSMTGLPLVNASASADSPVILCGYIVATKDYDDSVSAVSVSIDFGSGTEQTDGTSNVAFRIRNTETSALYDSAYNTTSGSSPSISLNVDYVAKGYVIAMGVATPGNTLNNYIQITGSGSSILSSYYNGSGFDDGTNDGYAARVSSGNTTLSAANRELVFSYNNGTAELSALALCFH